MSSISFPHMGNPDSLTAPGLLLPLLSEDILEHICFGDLTDTSETAREEGKR